MGRSCTIAEVESFIRADLPGNVLTYFIADNTRGYDGLDKCLHGTSNPTLLAVVDRMRRLANAGRVDLVQRRKGDQTRYQAVWRARVRPLPKDAHLPRLVA